MQRPLIAANEGAADMAVTACLGEAAAMANEASGWMLLAPYGEHAHDFGLQVVDQAAANAMSGRLRQAWDKLTRLFTTGSAALPIYQGHPDDEHFADRHPDTTVYGRVHELRAGQAGLEGRVEWTPAGDALRAGGRKLYFSPRWMMTPTGADRRFTPSRLVSIGLTPRPNIAGAAANEAPPASDKPANPQDTMLAAILKALGYSEEQIAAITSGAQGAPTIEDILAKFTGMQQQAAAPAAAANERATTLQAQLTAETARATGLQTQLTAANERLATERRARACLVVDGAIAAGRVTAAQREAEVTALAGAADEAAFANAATTLGARPPVLPTQTTVGNLGARKGPSQTSIAAANEFRAAVELECGKNGGDYDRAWANVRQAKPELYQRMNAPAE